MNEEKMQDSPLSFKVILLGDSGVGKTAFIRQFIDHQFESATRPTCGVDFMVKTCRVDEFTIKLYIFDTAGQERYKSLARMYFKGADSVLFMYDMTNKNSFANLNFWIDFYQKQSDRKDEVFILVGTKKDLVESSAVPNQTIDRDQIKQLVEKYRFTFKFETSAKTNLNVDLVFQQLARNLIYNDLNRRKSGNPIKEEQWSLILKKDKEHLLKEEQKSKGCC